MRRLQAPVARPVAPAPVLRYYPRALTRPARPRPASGSRPGGRAAGPRGGGSSPVGPGSPLLDHGPLDALAVRTTPRLSSARDRGLN